MLPALPHPHRALRLLAALTFCASAAGGAQAQVGFVRTNGPIPGDAVLGGANDPQGTPLYVCRVPYRGGVHPGKVWAGNCNIGWGGNEIVIAPPFEVLVGDGQWGPPRRGLAGAYVGGSEPERQLPLCRAAFEGGMHPGKVVAGRCNIGWGGREHTLVPFEVFYASAQAVSAPTSPPFDPVPAAPVRLRTAFTGPNACLDVVNDGRNNRLQMAACGNYSGQAWTLQPADTAGHYRLTNAFTGSARCLDIVNDGANDRVQMADCGNYSGQMWRLDRTHHPWQVRLRTMFTGPRRCLDIVNDGRNNQLRMADCGDYSGQFWTVQ